MLALRPWLGFRPLAKQWLVLAALTLPECPKKPNGQSASATESCSECDDDRFGVTRQAEKSIRQEHKTLTTDGEQTLLSTDLRTHTLALFMLGCVRSCF